MNKRLCFLSPDVDHAQQVVEDLVADGVQESCIYVIANDRVCLEGLPGSGSEEDDLVPAVERSIALGSVTGIFLGLVAVMLGPAGIVVGGGSVLLVATMNASLAAWLTGIVGAAVPNSRLQAFESEIARGRILMLVDVPSRDVTRTNALIQRQDSAINVEGVEPSAPLIP